MLTLPDEYNTLFAQLQPIFSKRAWQLALVLLVGAILAPGKRTVTAILRIMGLSQERHFQNYHRVLNRATWSNLALSLILFRLLLNIFLPVGPVTPLQKEYRPSSKRQKFNIIGACSEKTPNTNNPH